MAQKVHIVLVDDLDGSDATQTVSFGLDGTSYELDLNDKNAAALREALSGYVGHARKVGASRRGRARKAAATSVRCHPGRDQGVGTLAGDGCARPRPGLGGRTRGIRGGALSAALREQV